LSNSSRRNWRLA
jgi:hypothetical protein